MVYKPAGHDTTINARIPNPTMAETMFVVRISFMAIDTYPDARGPRLLQQMIIIVWQGILSDIFHNLDLCAIWKNLRLLPLRGT
jgi:hypothetical protein